MKFLTTMIAAALFATASFADDLAERRVAAASYLQSPAQQKMIDAMFAPDQMLGLLKAQAPNLTAEQLDAVAKIVSEELATIRTNMEKVMVDVAVDQFTLEELKALDAFYRSEVGEAVMLKMPGFMQNYMSGMGPDMARMQQNIGRRVATEVLNQ